MERTPEAEDHKVDEWPEQKSDPCDERRSESKKHDQSQKSVAHALDSIRA
jgi:hypothetical protein